MPRTPDVVVLDDQEEAEVRWWERHSEGDNPGPADCAWGEAFHCRVHCPAAAEVCCGCGSPEVVYHNYLNQPLCCPCAKCCPEPDPPRVPYLAAAMIDDACSEPDDIVPALLSQGRITCRCGWVVTGSAETNLHAFQDHVITECPRVQLKRPSLLHRLLRWGSYRD